MVFEEILQKTVEEYSEFTDKIRANHYIPHLDFIMKCRDEIFKMHQSMKPIKDKFSFEKALNDIETNIDSLLVSEYYIVHPNGNLIRWKHFDSSTKNAVNKEGYTGRNKDASMVVKYIHQNRKLSKLNIYFPSRIFPQELYDGLAWTTLYNEDPGLASIFKNETKFGKIQANLVEGNGRFFSNRRNETIPVKLWQRGEKENCIKDLIIDTGILGTGVLTDFFKHINYLGLEKFYKN